MVSQVQAFFRPYDATLFAQASRPYRLMLQIDRYLSWSSQKNMVIDPPDKQDIYIFDNASPFYKSALKVLSFAGIAASLYLFPEKRKAILATLGTMLLTKIIFRLYMTKDHKLKGDQEAFFKQIPEDFFRKGNWLDLIPLIPQNQIFEFKMSAWDSIAPIAHFVKWLERAKQVNPSKAEKVSKEYIYGLLGQLKDEQLVPSNLETIFADLKKISSLITFQQPFNLHFFIDNAVWLRIDQWGKDEGFHMPVRNKNDALLMAIVKLRKMTYEQGYAALPRILGDLKDQLQNLPNGNSILFIGLSYLLPNESAFRPISGQQDPRRNLDSLLGKLEDLPTNFEIRKEQSDD